MLFLFLKYLQPTHYFQLYRKDGTSIFPIIENLPNEIVEQLVPEAKFKSEKARKYDLSWQAVNKGYIGNTEVYTSFEKLPVIDEYRFLRKYFHSIWVFYVLMLRLLSFKNPFREFSAWKKSRDTVRSNYLNKPIKHPDCNKQQSSLVEDKPLVSVVIPTLNRYKYLKDVLADFEKQTYKNFEILIIDQSQPFQKVFCKDFNLKIHHIQQNEPALWLARNTAIEKSEGSIIALSEDDVRIGPDWIENHLRCLDFFKADISAGVFYPEGSSIPKERSFFCVASQFATGNAMLYKDVFKKIGLFDRQFEKQRMGDGEFGLRAYLNGLKSISNPYASCIDVKAGTGGLRQMGSWDAFRPKKLFAPRPIPSVLYLYRKYYGRKRSLLAILKTVPQSIIPYRYKKNKKMMVLGLFISLFLFPFVVLQVVISWRLATKKLREGAMIKRL
ncbi:glycosyltransferase family 2 protein [Aequorivita lipolytica]|uniref:Glycosyltransferase family 2 protein n=1 Tax=Aequorivita lipolytica TaxID=153267 RepID=A0A5C6YPK9_9FLAO|nr:glycosyltransferase family A protein [Aequorivita lipolytica]TXD68806.1 glycosyltransferase family 2 protein [Aequorivita lipolytica]SRX52057.1 Putative glycosyltransferase EpsH [Aequorivita lipolytica]